MFEIEATGSPKPEVEWSHEGKTIKADNRIKITENGNKYKLEILDTKLEDAGSYKVVVKNKLGEKFQTGDLSVTRKLNF